MAAVINTPSAEMTEEKGLLSSACVSAIYNIGVGVYYNYSELIAWPSQRVFGHFSWTV